jgi:hypothetical protein
MWQRVLIKKQISSIITSKSPKTCTKALFSTRKTDAANKPQNNQNSYTAFAESLNQHKITLNVQQSDVNSNFARTNSSGSKNNNNKYYRAESANLLEDLNKRINSVGMSNLLAALAGQYLLWWLLRLLDDGV